MKRKQNIRVQSIKRDIFWGIRWVDGEPLYSEGRNIDLDYKFNTHKRVNHRDNKLVYNTSGALGDWHNKIRIPSLKRNDYTWKHFYRLFPYCYVAMRNIDLRGFNRNELSRLKKMYLPEFEAELREHPIFSKYFNE